MPPKILVTGAGGFIGGHLVTYLKSNDYWVRGVEGNGTQIDTD